MYCRPTNRPTNLTSRRRSPAQENKPTNLTSQRRSPAQENKEEFVAQLGFLLAKHGVQGVNGLRYEKTDAGEELVKIFFDSGRIKVNVTGDSCLALMRDIAKALT